MALKNFFVHCLCGFDVRIDYLDQQRSCPDCGRLVQIADSVKEYLKSTYTSEQLVPADPA